MTPQDVRLKTFKVALRGYHIDEVDEFLERVELTLRERQAGREGELTPQNVQQQTFKVALRGYAEGEVDQFLDEVVIALREYAQKNPSVDAPSVVVPKRKPVRLSTGADGSVAEFREPRSEPADEEPPPTQVEATPATDARILITRSGTTGGRPFTVMFDDQPLGKLKPGATAEFDIPTGLHWVSVKTRRHESNTMMIEPHEGDLIRLECQPASGDEFDDLGRNIEGILLERVDS